jgi:hypothetical protein
VNNPPGLTWAASRREVLVPTWYPGYSGKFDWTCHGTGCGCRNDRCDRACPCGRKWKSKNDYVKCCKRDTDAQVKEGAIDAAEQEALKTGYRESGCGASS